MRTLTRILLAASGAAFAVLSTTSAHAQKDIHPQLPNVLLLVDNSGSMEFMMNPSGQLPNCSAVPADRNRWANLVTVLTGSITDANFSCVPLNRHSAGFINEFSEPGPVAPYDKNYYLPFNRIYSNHCTYGAGTLPATWNWWNLPSSSPGTYVDSQWVDPSGNVVHGTCPFQQSGDGLLDAFKGLVRFGMMTLDTLPDPSTGSTASSNPATASSDFPGAQKGMWSYFHNWTAGAGSSPSVSSGPPTPVGGAGAGNPAGCPTPSFFEVGARNQAAPPWEGRLVPFGDWQSDATVPTTNDQIQLELLSSRPYGATPVAALLDDANEFLFHDATPVPGTTHAFGPTDDAYWAGGCRKTYVILMSDGLDNMDLRSKNLTKSVNGANAYNGCDSAAIPPKGGGANVAGNCPYLPADTIITSLRTNAPPNQSVLTFVVGFTGSDMTKFNPVPSVPSGATTCDKLVPATDCVFPPLPAPQPSNDLRSCCELQKLAIAGNTSQAYFADDPVKLKVALAGILSQIVQGTTDRTSPVYAPAGLRGAQGTALQATPTAAYQFAASFAVTSAAPPAGSPSGVGNIPGGPWTGLLYRERFACGVSGTQAVAQDPTSPGGRALGDDYALNVDYADSSNPRMFFTAIGTDVGHGHNSEIDSDYTMRPYIGSVDDGFGTYTPDPAAPKSPQLSSTFPGSMSGYPAAFAIPADSACNSAFHDTNATDCTKFLVNWEIGGDNALPAAATFQTRDWRNCPTACPQGPLGCACRQLGGIFHSTPAVAGPPREFLRDDSYTTYANTPAVAGQETMLYTATMDGQLHAFKVQAGNTSPDSFFTDHQANNERWSFFPARVLQHLLPNYNTGGVPLLDGVPVVVDVPGTVYDIASSAPLLQRSGATPVGWHRVLVSSGGGGGGFYYALEITNPEDPHFLWQVSTDAIGTPLFGSATPTPAVAIASISLTSGSAPVLLPIAILPGGTGAPGTGCSSATLTSPVGASFARIKLDDPLNQHLLPSITATPPSLRCWDTRSNPGRSSGNSLTIVRLDTGKVLAHFIGQNYSGGPHNNGDHGGDNGHGGDDNHKKTSSNPNVFDAPFIAPVTGTPVVYPGQTGQVSDRVYIGDADGLVWRLDMTNPDITTWGANITLAWDAYINDGAGQREALGVPPIISRDAIGNPVILVATGDQDTFSAQTSSNHVWSLTEDPASNAQVSPNWHIRMPSNGARITGPMALFNSTLYFATFQPVAGNVCADGYGSVWAVDYIRRGTISVAGGGTPAGMTPVNGVWPLPEFPTITPGAYIYGQDGAPGTIVMGVSLSQTPTCDTTSISPDAYFGGHTAVSGATGSSYQVSWQTGGAGGLSTTNTAVKNDNVKGMQYLQPPAPGRGTRFDSWASIVE